MRKIALAVVAILALLFVMGCQPTTCPEKTCPSCEVCPEQKECLVCEECEECDLSQIPQGKAMLDVDMYTWGENELDSSEVLFDYWLTNFGDSEAKNVKVRCKLTDANGVTAISTLDDYGNIASTTAQLGEVLTKKTSKYSATTEYSGYCYVESCTNCDILYKRIPALIEGYES